MSIEKLIRLPLCLTGLCRTFITQSDETGCWGECTICGKRVGFVDRATLRRFTDAEYEREMASRNNLGASNV